MSENTLHFPVSMSADNVLDGSFNVEIKSIEIEGKKIGFKPELPEEALKGKFRLMSGKIYRVINDEPLVSGLLNLAEEIKADDDRPRS